MWYLILFHLNLASTSTCLFKWYAALAPKKLPEMFYGIIRIYLPLKILFKSKIIDGFFFKIVQANLCF